MEERYKKMSKLGVRNIDGYNARVSEAKTKGEKLTRTVHTGYDKESGEAIYETENLELEPLPFVVVIVDEMADLMMVAGKDIEGAVQRLAQMARAAGLHVILATQRPSVDVITGTIKANFPTRVSFQVTSKIDSRTILGEQGAEQLLGQGDMLYMAGGGRISRVHGPFVSDEEVEKVVRHLKAQGTPQYLEAVTAEDEEDEDGNPIFDATGMGQADGGDLYQQAVQVVMRDRKASTGYIQRRLQIGYNRAASLMERMEKEGVVGQANDAGKREILVGEEDTVRYWKARDRGLRLFAKIRRLLATRGGYRPEATLERGPWLAWAGDCWLGRHWAWSRWLRRQGPRLFRYRPPRRSRRKGLPPRANPRPRKAAAPDWRRGSNRSSIWTGSPSPPRHRRRPPPVSTPRSARRSTRSAPIYRASSNWSAILSRSVPTAAASGASSTSRSPARSASTTSRRAESRSSPMASRSWCAIASSPRRIFIRSRRRRCAIFSPIVSTC